MESSPQILEDRRTNAIFLDVTSRPSAAVSAESEFDTRTESGELYEELPSGRLMKIPHGFLTSKMIEEQTGLTSSEIRGYIRRNLLKGADKNSQGWMLFSIEDVNRIVRLKDRSELKKAGNRIRPTKLSPASSDSKMVYSVDEGVSVFTMLRSGLAVDEIFLKTKIHPGVIHTIIKDYELLTKSIILSRAKVDELNKLSLEGNFPLATADDVVEVMKLAAQGRLCPTCTKRPHSDQCERCTRHRVIKSMERDAKLRKLLPADDSNLTSLDEGAEEDEERPRRDSTRTEE